jgi:sulfate transport system substrate-binding protein
VVDKRGSRELAKSYLDHLYTPEGQKIAAEFGLRVNDAAVAAEFKDKFPEVRLVNVEDCLAAGPKFRKSILPQARCSTSSTARAD